MQAAEDCHLLDHVFDTVSPQLWPLTTERAAATGYAAESSCRSLYDNPTGELQYARTWMDPDYAGGCGLDAAIVYHATDNPEGVRCTLQDYARPQWGRRPADGFANRPYDNVGVQYGLRAVEAGAISVEQFVDLNANVGGLDIDWNYQPERSVADPGALVLAYRGGRVTQRAVPRPRADHRPARLQQLRDPHRRALLRDPRAAGRGERPPRQPRAVDQLLRPGRPDLASSRRSSRWTRWLAAIEADTTADPREAKVLRHRPADRGRRLLGRRPADHRPAAVRARCSRTTSLPRIDVRRRR